MKTVHVSGKRKKAIARATARPGSGRIRVNNKLLDVVEPELIRIKMREPLILSGVIASNIDIDIIIGF